MASITVDWSVFSSFGTDRIICRRPNSMTVKPEPNGLSDSTAQRISSLRRWIASASIILVPRACDILADITGTYNLLILPRDPILDLGHSDQTAVLLPSAPTHFDDPYRQLEVKVVHTGTKRFCPKGAFLVTRACERVHADRRTHPCKLRTEGGVRSDVFCVCSRELDERGLEHFKLCVELVDV